MPKHLQFAQINKKLQSDVNKKLIVQRSELIVSKKRKFENRAKAIEKTCNDVLTIFLGLESALLSKQSQKALGLHQKYYNLCSEDKRRS